ncbi:MAG TPA: ferredoxin--NADP reductase [Burkholderiales bacterium]|nr:ferredoxin--NADP reductase [Burkholderiales bacterium]
MSGKWLAGKVVENRRWTDSLFSLRVEGVDLRFEAGQFVRIALDIGAERVARAFSFVNPPGDATLEFYGVVVPQGPLSPRLATLRAGDALHIAPNPAGFLVLSEVPDAQTLWLISTGTGIAPFLSILRTEAPWRRFRRVVLVHAVRRANELAYREMIGKTDAHYVSFVSRENAPGSLAGRIPAAIEDGRLEAAAGVEIRPENSHVMLCGNPDMLKDVQAVLVARGLRKHRRRAPGHITVESFW